ncbi:hypothetical protein [Phaeovulum sp.]|uniref:hypothetical protein n=1 Tax=Phaeovulum sp. TaxID=2934796 RepID=UPI0035635903
MAALAFAACSSDETDGGTGGGTGGSTGTSPETPVALKVNVNEIVFNGTTLQVSIDSLDSTPVLVDYVRDPSLDVGGYLAFRVQEDALDRLFIALAKESDDGAVRAVTAADGGQFNRYFAGGVYERTGDFLPPTIGTGPGAGQVSYAGSYAAVTNVRVARGGPTDVAIDTTETGVLVPGQSSRVSGDIFLNVNFLDESINGAIYNRVLIDQSLSLADIVLVRADIAEDGTFLGSAEYDDPSNTVVGTYGGIFGGVDANSVAGLVNLEEFNDDWENEREHGVFVLTQCGPSNTLPICSSVAPFP